MRPAPALSRSRRETAAEIIREYSFTKGPLGLPKLVAKVLLLVPRQRLHRRWLSTLGGTTTRRLLHLQPRMAFRHSSKYLFLGIPWRQSVALLTAHYAFLNESLDAPMFDRIIGADGERLWATTVAGHRLEIALRGPDSHREGELNICFVVDRVRVANIAFSIVPAAPFASGERAHAVGHLIYIGHVQGTSGHFDLIQTATRLCHDIAPNDLLMSGLSTVSRALGIERILAPGPTRHLSVDKMPESAFDYAAFWARYGGTLGRDGHYAIDLPFPRKPLARIVNRHRKRTSRKRAFKDALCDSIAFALAANIRPADAGVKLPSDPRTTAAARRSRTAS